MSSTIAASEQKKDKSPPAISFDSSWLRNQGDTLSKEDEDPRCSAPALASSPPSKEENRQDFRKWQDLMEYVRESQDTLDHAEFMDKYEELKTRWMGMPMFRRRPGRNTIDKYGTALRLVDAQAYHPGSVNVFPSDWRKDMSPEKFCERLLGLRDAGNQGESVTSKSKEELASEDAAGRSCQVSVLACGFRNAPEEEISSILTRLREDYVDLEHKEASVEALVSVLEQGEEVEDPGEKEFRENLLWRRRQDLLTELAGIKHSGRPTQEIEPTLSEADQDVVNGLVAGAAEYPFITPTIPDSSESTGDATSTRTGQESVTRLSPKSSDQSAEQRFKDLIGSRVTRPLGLQAKGNHGSIAVALSLQMSWLPRQTLSDAEHCQQGLMYGPSRAPEEENTTVGPSMLDSGTH